MILPDKLCIVTRDDDACGGEISLEVGTRVFNQLDNLGVGEIVRWFRPPASGLPYGEHLPMVLVDWRADEMAEGGWYQQYQEDVVMVLTPDTAGAFIEIGVPADRIIAGEGRYPDLLSFAAHLDIAGMVVR